MAKWFSDTQTTNGESEDEGAGDEEERVCLPSMARSLPAWKPMTPKTLFGEATKPRLQKPSKHVIEEEEQLMEQLANAVEAPYPMMEPSTLIWRRSINHMEYQPYIVLKLVCISDYHSM
ncbi:unnamed protein product [Mycena citricolor]|uniref:Uncharacterized protein n=1 Tax=Mycena citricolor TaxID=2018698 RepID=A0AAD2Q1Y4_9AGAR|nr:unnamed protein product [Mycena citricolor]